MHPKMAEALDKAFDEIAAIQKRARAGKNDQRPIWPMIVLRTPKGWTCPKTVDGLKTEGFWRAHQVPFTLENPEHIPLLEEWMKSYRPDQLFDQNGALVAELAALAPKGERRISADPTPMAER